ncbi:uncharacterized protein LOC143630853 [Bidens hawaiensis]|uniref:uncharacterized protein LOC143630853 n=1 Tax=Bidens hawaiensis TaxID=980011 RepID=UPI00404B5C7D
MGKIETEGDSVPLETGKNSKKSKKNKTSNVQDIDNGDSCLNTASVILKDNKLKSVLKSDEAEKGNTDGNLAKKIKKKRKHKITENESKLKVKSQEVKFSSNVETFVDSRLNEADELANDNKLKSVLNEDDVENGQGDDGSLAKVNEIESKLKVELKKVSLPSQAETFEGSCINVAGDSSKDSKLKSVLIEDRDASEKVKENDDNLAKKTKKKRKHVATENEPNSKVKAKKVSFSSHVEIFPSPDTEKKKLKTEEDKLVRGKRFTPEEDAIVKDAVLSFIKSRNLGEEGLSMVLNSMSYPELRNCWKTIGTCIPYRPYLAVYYRAHSLFERGEKRKWTKEETELLLESYEKRGKSWKIVAEELGKNRVHVKDKWRRIKLKNKKAGKWSQEEYQTLYDLVNLDLQTKAVSQEKKSKHGMLRDNISWGEISDKLSTRTDDSCCVKWYKQLTSSLVQEGKWSNADDYRLIKALYDLDAACIEDVDWDCVLEHRPGDICRKRWDQMVKHIGHHGSKPFIDQVEILSQRYCPDLAETREIWDSVPLTE